MADVAVERRQTDQDLAALKEWKVGHSEQCQEREARTDDRLDRLEGRFDRLETYLHGISTKLLFAILGGVAFAIWQLAATHLHLQ